jgi:hypothetical protein
MIIVSLYIRIIPEMLLKQRYWGISEKSSSI